jgi:hypothetical protein
MSEEKAIERLGSKIEALDGKLGDKIDGVKTDIGILKTNFAVQETKLDRVIIDLDEVKTIVEGDGLAKKVNNLENWRDSMGKWGKWILGILATFIAGGILALLFR